jgi:hypothetical protein
VQDLIERAIGGDESALYARLERGSKLPGTHPNLEFASTFAAEMASIGPRAAQVAISMATLHADHARGGTSLEFLPMCGVLAVGALAANEKDRRKRAQLVMVLHDAAEDLRFRVRDMVPIALARVGARDPSLAHETQAWMDGFSHAAAVLRAMSTTEWSSAIEDAEAPAARLAEAFTLLMESSRAAVRYPGYKALVDAVLGSAPAFILRFGGAIFDVLGEVASKVKEPALRETVRTILSDRKLSGRFAEDIARVREVLDRTEPPPRDARHRGTLTRRRGRPR